ncbi:addiction module antidote protein [Cellvibrio sp. pealriver]|uniref:addiction module antidote protein n=1 Tax=Cellvibrio sp. pealriver TaxID=1622269 RepID=UPI00066FD92A|nr:addiction module antidote protein [Cellvibrio sp. pealriver]
MKPTFTLFDAADYLEDEETIAAYLNAAIESGDTELLLVALKDVANARSMTQLAKDSGLARASLYKALTPGAKPQFETVMKVAGALGLKLEFHPVTQH